MKHAIVIGGSMAGLLAAQALSTHVDHVTVIERDVPGNKPEPRKGAPQGRHIHALLARGARILERLLPGLQDNLGAAGAPLVDWIGDSCVSNQFGAMPRFTSDLRTRACSRPLLEFVIRNRVLQNPRVTFQMETDAWQLVTTDDHARVIGVNLRHRATGALSTLLADLVVDASGRSSKAFEWLTALGLTPPTEQVVNSALAYASRVVRMPADFKPDFKLLIQRIRPPHGRRGGGMYLIENNTWMVTLGGAKDEQPPLDDSGFIEFARQLDPNLITPNASSSAPLLHDLLARSEPLTPIVGYQRTENRWRHFEELERMPAGFVLMGDAVCAFNPVYGQGMSTAAMGAELLQQWVADGGSAKVNGTRAFQKSLANLVRTPWLLATGEDARAVGIVDRTRAVRFNHAYIDALLGLTNSNHKICKAFLDVAHLVKPPASLFAPGIALPVLIRMVATTASKRSKPSPRPTKAEALVPIS